MKILSANLCFKLPDTFEGNFVDALDQFIQYRLSNPTIIPEEGKATFTGLSDTELSEQRNTYRTVMDAHKSGIGQRAAFSFALCELDEVNNTWVPITNTNEELTNNESRTT